MAAPGTNTLERIDTTTKLREEHWIVTTQPGGVVLRSGLSRILFVEATFAQLMVNPATLSVEIDATKQIANVYSTSDVPRLVHVTLTGE